MSATIKTASDLIHLLAVNNYNIAHLTIIGDTASVQIKLTPAQFEKQSKIDSIINKIVEMQAIVKANNSVLSGIVKTIKEINNEIEQYNTEIQEKINC